MPLYDLECVECGQVVEKLFTTCIDFLTYDEFRTKVEKVRAKRKAKFEKENPGYGLIDTIPDTIGEVEYYSFEDIKKYPKFHNVEWQKCDCGGFQELVAPLCAMQPDNMWAGTDTRMGYFTSKSKYERTLKDRNIATVDKKELDKINKNVYNVKQDKIKKQINNLNSFVEKELASVEISPDGNTVKEKNKYARKRQ
jgi:hypothetical protein